MLFLIETESFVVEASFPEEAARSAALEMRTHPNVPVMNAVLHDPDEHGPAEPQEIWTAEKIRQHMPTIDQ